MKKLYDEKTRTRLTYTTNHIILRCSDMEDGDASFTRKEFQEFLTFLNECDIKIGREDVLSEYKDGN